MNALLPLAAVVLSGGGAIGLLVTIIVVGLIYWVCTLIPLPAPFLKIAQAVCIIVAVIAVINWLLGMDGHAFIAY